MIISINVEKVCYMPKVCYMLKTLIKLGIEGKFHNLVKVIYPNLTAIFHTKWRNLSFFLKCENKTRYLLSVTTV